MQRTLDFERVHREVDLRRPLLSKLPLKKRAKALLVSLAELAERFGRRDGVDSLVEATRKELASFMRVSVSTIKRCLSDLRCCPWLTIAEVAGQVHQFQIHWDRIFRYQPEEQLPAIVRREVVRNPEHATPAVPSAAAEVHGGTGHQRRCDARRWCLRRDMTREMLTNIYQVQVLYETAVKAECFIESEASQREFFAFCKHIDRQWEKLRNPIGFMHSILKQGYESMAAQNSGNQDELWALQAIEELYGDDSLDVDDDDSPAWSENEEFQQREQQREQLLQMAANGEFDQ